jgi:hypothetical protein
VISCPGPAQHGAHQRTASGSRRDEQCALCPRYAPHLVAAKPQPVGNRRGRGKQELIARRCTPYCGPGTEGGRTRPGFPAVSPRGRMRWYRLPSPAAHRREREASRVRCALLGSTILAGAVVVAALANPALADGGNGGSQSGQPGGVGGTDSTTAAGGDGGGSGFSRSGGGGGGAGTTGGSGGTALTGGPGGAGGASPGAAGGNGADGTVFSGTPPWGEAGAAAAPPD